MRKRYKKKLKSCAMCKPHKMGYEKRWRPREEVALREYEQTRQRLEGFRFAV